MEKDGELPKAIVNQKAIKGLNPNEACHENSPDCALYKACKTRSGVKGRLLNLTPVASKTALAKAAPVGP
jgi:hypothetical protein